MAAALQAWVETGQAPDRVTGRTGLPGLATREPVKERPLCAYPSQAALQPAQATSYVCAKGAGSPRA